LPYCVCGDTEVGNVAEEVSIALERLAERQKHRQYSATNVSSSASVTRCSSTQLTGDSENTVKWKRVQSAHVASRRSSGRRKEIGPDGVNDDEESTDPKHDPPSVHGSQQRLQQFLSRRSSAAGHQPSDTAGLNYFENQRCMIEQSRALLEQSKAKHHALVAQAHSMQKSLRSHISESESQPTLAPKPPSAPPADKKPTSTFRTQRLTRYADLRVLHESSGVFGCMMRMIILFC